MSPSATDFHTSAAISTDPFANPSFRYALAGFVWLMSVMLTGWGLQERSLGPDIPAPLSGILTEKPVPVSLAGLMALDGRPLAASLLDGRWTVICPDLSACGFENGLPPESIARVLAGLKTARTGVALFQVLHVIPGDMNMPAQRVGDVQVMPVSVSRNARAALPGDGRVLIIDPYGRHFASVPPSDPVALATALGAALDHLDREVSAFML